MDSKLNIALKDVRKQLKEARDELRALKDGQKQTNAELSEIKNMISDFRNFFLEVTVSEANDTIEELSEDGSTSEQE